MVPYLYTTYFISVIMKLQKSKAYKYKDKLKYKYTIVVPQKDIKKLGWDKGTELKGIVIDKKGYFLFSK